MSLSFWIGVGIFGILYIKTNILVAISILIIYTYFIFKQRSKVFATSIKLLLSESQESVIMNLSLNQLKYILESRNFIDKNIEIKNGFTFNIDDEKFIVSPVGRNKTSIKLS